MSHSCWRWVWSRGRKQHQSRRTPNSQLADGVQALGGVPEAGWTSPPSWMPVARGRTGESRDSLLSSVADFSVLLSLAVPFLPTCEFILWEPTSSGDNSTFPLHWNTKYIEDDEVLRWCLSTGYGKHLRTAWLCVYYKIYFSRNQAWNDLSPYQTSPLERSPKSRP